MDEPTVVQSVETLEELVPCEKPPQCTREAFLNPPDWRYQEAVQYLEDERNGKTPIIPKDSIVHLMIRGLRAMRRPRNRQFMKELWPVVWMTLRLGTALRNSAIVAEMESHIIAGHSPEALVEAQCTIPVPIYRMYGKMFMDLDGITAVHSWFNDFLFEPEKYKKSSKLLLARLSAYYGSAEVGVASAITGKESKEVTALLGRIAQTERQKDIFGYVLKAMNMDPTEYALVMEAALKSMTERDFQEHMRDRLEAGSDSLVDLAANIAEGVRQFSQSEMEQYNQNGFDPVNGYTSIICNERATEDGR